METTPLSQEEKIKEQRIRNQELKTKSCKDMECQPFYIGEKVLAVDAMRGSKIKNGTVYEISSCQYLPCNGNHFWYVGVIGIDNNFLRPTIFASTIQAKLMKFETLNEEYPIHIN